MKPFDLLKKLLSLPALACSLALVSDSLAERPVESIKVASHTITGTVTYVFTRDGAENHKYAVLIQIDGVEKGEGFKKNEYIYAYAYQRKADAPRVPASNGHSAIPKEGARIRAHLKQGNGLMEALYPDWFEVLPPLTTKAHGKVGPALRKNLIKQLERYKSAPYIDVKEWHYGERKAGELEGTWLCGGAKAVFGADGSFSESFDSTMTKGLYAISDKGLIVTYSVRESGHGLGSSYRLQSDGKTLLGVQGPNPNAVWIRAKGGK